MTQESQRLQEAREGTVWRKWGPYLSERQWGTVREDYSKDGNAWDYFSHGWTGILPGLCISLRLQHQNKFCNSGKKQ